MEKTQDFKEAFIALDCQQKYNFPRSFIFLILLGWMKRFGDFIFLFSPKILVDTMTRLRLERQVKNTVRPFFFGAHLNFNF